MWNAGKRLLKDHSGSTDIERVIILAIAFVIGTALVMAVAGALRQYFGSGMHAHVADWLS